MHVLPFEIARFFLIRPKVGLKYGSTCSKAVANAKQTPRLESAHLMVEFVERFQGEAALITGF